MGNWFLLFAALLEVVGAFLMAGAYLSGTRPGQRFLILLNALVRGDQARGAATVDRLNEANKLNILQGMALIGLGFLMQAGVVACRLLD